MNVIVQSKTMVVTQAIRNFVVQHTRKLFRRGQNIGNITVFLENIKHKKNDMQAASAKILVDLPGKNIMVQERAKDLYLAINQASKSTMRKMRKMKEKRQTSRERMLSHKNVESFA